MGRAVVESSVLVERQTWPVSNQHTRDLTNDRVVNQTGGTKPSTGMSRF